MFILPIPEHGIKAFGFSVIGLVLLLNLHILNPLWFWCLSFQGIQVHSKHCSLYSFLFQQLLERVPGSQLAQAALGEGERSLTIWIYFLSPFLWGGGVGRLYGSRQFVICFSSVCRGRPSGSSGSRSPVWRHAGVHARLLCGPLPGGEAAGGERHLAGGPGLALCIDSGWL